MGVTGLMESYNRLGTCMVGYDKALLTDVLRGEWNFRGVVNTDAFAVDNGDYAVRAGVDMQLAMGIYTTDKTTSSNYGMQCLRTSIKRHLMIYANSSAMTSIRNWTPYWIWIIVAVDAVLVAVAVAIGLPVVKPAFFPKKVKETGETKTDDKSKENK